MTENRLGDESSPYLLQHKDNPVHWHGWNPETLATARKDGKPILLSVGYAACHWCHVMAHESFEDNRTAALMNDLFVNIKVDREERPDIDTIYQAALQMLGEQGGWPLTMFLTPDGEPFWGGTYFPPEERYGRPGFPDVLRHVAKIFRDNPERVRQNADALREGLVRLGEGRPGGALSFDTLDEVAAAMVREVDPTMGGLHGAPKFPQPALFSFLWRAALRTGAPDMRNAVLVTAERMCQGGIYDHLGGGFSRYSTDALWLAPHFEKMLYDNAGLISLLSIVYRDTSTPLFIARIEQTIGWLLREMIAEGGAFAASLDADSEGEEGRFYVWGADEVDILLGPDARFFKQTYDISPRGNWEGKNIPHRLRVPTVPDEEEAQLALLRARLLDAREKRVRPARDDKVLADWNGEMIAALAEAAARLGRDQWLAPARQAFDVVCREMSRGDRLVHSTRAGKSVDTAMLDDYANMAMAALALFEATGEDSYLARAQTWVAVADKHYWDQAEGGYFFTADDGEALLVRTKTVIDNATPSGNGVMLGNLARLYYLTGEDAYRARAEALIAAFSGQLDSASLAMATFLNNYELLARGVQIVCVAGTDPAATGPMMAAVRAASPAHAIVSRLAADAALADGHPAYGKGAVDGKPTVYVCHGTTCSLPITDPDAVAPAIENP